MKSATTPFTLPLVYFAGLLLIVAIVSVNSSYADGHSSGATYRRSQDVNSEPIPEPIPESVPESAPEQSVPTVSNPGSEAPVSDADTGGAAGSTIDLDSALTYGLPADFALQTEGEFSVDVPVEVELESGKLPFSNPDQDYSRSILVLDEENDKELGFWKSFGLTVATLLGLNLSLDSDGSVRSPAQLVSPLSSSLSFSAAPGEGDGPGLSPIELPDTANPTDPDAMDPMDPDTMGPMAPETANPMDPDTMYPMDPDAMYPTDPDAMQPQDPDTANPTEPMDPDPVPFVGSSLTFVESTEGRFTTMTGTFHSDVFVLNGAAATGEVQLQEGSDTFAIAGTSSVSSSIDAGYGSDTFVWMGGTISTAEDALADTVQWDLLTGFEHLTLAPTDGLTLSVSSTELLGAIDPNAHNHLTIGPGVTVTGAFDAGRNPRYIWYGDGDTFNWHGGTVTEAGGSPAGTVDWNLLTGFENLSLIPMGDIALSVSGGEILGTIDAAQNNIVSLGPDVTLTSELDLGARGDTFIWYGGTISADSSPVVNTIDWNLLKDLEDVRLLPTDGITLEVAGADILRATGSSYVKVAIGAGVTVTSRTAVSGLSTFTWHGGTVSSDVNPVVNTVDWSLLRDFTGWTLLPMDGIELTVAASDLFHSSNTSGLNVLTIGSGVTVTGEVRPNPDNAYLLDTFNWHGGTVSNEVNPVANTIDWNLLQGFGSVNLSPMGDLTLSVSGSQLTSALNTSGSNAITIGKGVTVTGELDAAGGSSDRFVWQGGTLGDGTAGPVDFSLLRGFEHYDLFSSAGAPELFVSDADIAGALGLRIGPGVEFFALEPVTLSYFQMYGGIAFADLQGTDGVNYYIFDGVYAGNTSLYAGNDWIDIVDGATTGVIDAGSGNDRFNIYGGEITGRLVGGAHQDTFDISGGTFNATVEGDTGNDTFHIRGGIFRAPVDGGAGNDTFHISGGRFNSTLAGGEGDDTFHISGGEITADGIVDGGEGGETNGDRVIFSDDYEVLFEYFDDNEGKFRGIELATIASGATLSASSLSFQQLQLQAGAEAIQLVLEQGGKLGMDGMELAFEVGQRSASRLHLDGSTADRFKLSVVRDYDFSSTDLSVRDALRVSGHLGEIETDGTAGLVCSGDAGGHVCHLHLYDRAVPAALAIASALSQTDSADLRPVEFTGIEVRQLRQAVSSRGRVGGNLNADTRTRGLLSGAEVISQQHFGNFGLRQSSRVTHLDLNTSVHASQGVHSLEGMLSGLSSRISLVWGSDDALVEAAAELSQHTGQSLSLYGQSVDTRVDSSRRALSLIGRKNLFGNGTLSARAGVNLRSNNLVLDGLDGLTVQVAEGSMHADTNLGLFGEYKFGNSDIRLDWALDLMHESGTQSAQVLNTMGYDVIDWSHSHAAVEWMADLHIGLGRRSSLQLGAGGDTSLGEESESDWRANLMFNTRF